MRIRRLLPALLVDRGGVARPGLAGDVRRREATGTELRRLFDARRGRPGVVSVTPDGDDYVVAWDLEKGIVLLGADPGALKAARFSYRLTQTDGGAWRLAADGFPTLSIDAPTDAGRMTGTFELRGFGLQGAYDPTQSDFLRAKLGVDVARRNSKSSTRSRRPTPTPPRPASSARCAPRPPRTAPASTSRPSIRSPRLRRPSSALRPTGRGPTR